MSLFNLISTPPTKGVFCRIGRGSVQQRQEQYQAPVDPLHTHEPVTVASFRTWRGWRDCVARGRCLTSRFYHSAADCWRQAGPVTGVTGLQLEDASRKLYNESTWGRTT